MPAHRYPRPPITVAGLFQPPTVEPLYEPPAGWPYDKQRDLPFCPPTLGRAAPEEA